MEDYALLNISDKNLKKAAYDLALNEGLIPEPSLDVNLAQVLGFYKKNKWITHACSFRRITEWAKTSNAKVINSLDEFVHWLKYKPEEIIYLNGYEVQFTKDGIKVGCQEVSKEIVEKIWKRLCITTQQ